VSEDVYKFRSVERDDAEDLLDDGLAECEGDAVN
jgi:hypothetical protein